MSDERRSARDEAEGQVKVTDRRRFRPDGEPVDEGPSGAAAEASDPAGPREEHAAQLAAQAARIDELTRAYAALVEDNKAFRQRLERERQRVLEAERAEVAQALLEAADDLERALSAVGDAQEGELRSLVEGVRLSLGVLQRRIAAVGAERIPVVGLPFDPHVAEAVDAVPMRHGALQVYGYRVGRFAVVTDVDEIPEASFATLAGVEVLVLSALRYRPHPTHFSLEQAIAAAARIGARRTVFTHIAHEIDHGDVRVPLPAGVEIGYDGLVVDCD